MLTTAQLGPLSRLLAASRTDWDVQGVMVFVEQLAKDPRPWPELQVQAIRQAANAKNLTPKCILTPLDSEAVVRTITPPVNDPTAGVGDVWCDVHMCRTTQRPDGRFVCCWQDEQMDATPKPVRPVAAPFRQAGPCPDSARELIEASIGPRRRAREQAQEAKGQGQ